MMDCIRIAVIGLVVGTAAASGAPQIIDDPLELSVLSWAAFHPSPDGLHQQMSILAKAGSRFHIEASEDLESWNTETTRYGFQDGQILETLLLSSPRHPAHLAAEVPAPHPSSR